MSKLTAARINALKERGLYGDGKGLWLQVSAFGTKAWVFRFMLAGRARTMGLGPYPEVSLKEARERAEKNRRQLRDGDDPIELRRAKRMYAKIEAAKQTTFDQCVEHYIAAHANSWKNAKHREQWTSTLATYAGPIIGNLSVAAIDTALVLNVLRPIWNKKPETASRLRGRIERILAWATVSGYRTGDNPARWRGHLKEMLPAKTKIHKAKHHKALPYTQLPEFMARLRSSNSISARALEFTILNASRTNEAIGAKLDEINHVDKIWTVPGERMKGGKDHRVPLSPRASEILQSIPQEGAYVFPGAKAQKPLSNMAMLELLRGMIGDGYTVHGFRSTFRDWAAERTNYPREIAEAALAHISADKVEAAYLRGDALEKRRLLMREWAAYCTSVPVQASATVVPLHEARA